MMKFSLGDGMFAREKFVYLHFNGADCAGMKKAKDNSYCELQYKCHFSIENHTFAGVFSSRFQ